MHIEVLGEDAISPQARTYAEYRVFAALTQHAGRERVRHARVVLRRANALSGGERVTCTVTVALEGPDSFRVKVTGDHAYAAINRAVDRIKADGTAHRVAAAPVETAGGFQLDENLSD